MTIARRQLLLFILLAAPLALTPRAQTPQVPTPPSVAPDNDGTPDNPTTPVTLFPHSDAARYLITGQANIVFQAHPGFHSPYSGPNSFLARGEYKTSLVGTLFLGYQLIANPRFNLDALYDEESAGGRGMSEALGLAGFTNLDVVRNPNLGSTPYMARVQLHQTIGLSSKLVDSQRTPFSLATKVPERRLDLRFGKMSLPDLLDLNGPGSDSHLQFLNWTADNNGAWDYAADTRGYTYAFTTEYTDRAFSARYALALMPTVANGIDLQWNLHRASGQNVELETRNSPLALLPGLHGKPGTVRLLGYVNHANMGDYRQQITEYLTARAAGLPVTAPDITAHPLQSTMKYGLGLNFEQQLSSGCPQPPGWPIHREASSRDEWGCKLPGPVRLFGRFGWNEGQHESYAYTEVDQTFQLGADEQGNRWNRPNDKLGLVLISNAIKRDHQNYLALGGQGFILGDGALSYAREDILETYYTAHNWRGLFTAFDLQLIAHPGYNQARGPVEVFTVRTHIDF